MLINSAQHECPICNVIVYLVFHSIRRGVLSVQGRAEKESFEIPGLYLLSNVLTDFVIPSLWVNMKLGRVIYNQNQARV